MPPDPVGSHLPLCLLQMLACLEPVANDNRKKTGYLCSLFGQALQIRRDKIKREYSLFSRFGFVLQQS